jgi:NCS2 family nucleobase:cation symporter-2
MYAGAVAVPLIIGRALQLPPEQIAILVNADLFICGIVTIIQSVGIGPFGIRLPIMMGVTFASVSPMLAMAENAELGLGAIFGSVIVAGIFGLIVAPFLSSLLRFFPPVVTGTIIAVIGIFIDAYWHKLGGRCAGTNVSRLWRPNQSACCSVCVDRNFAHY